MMDQNYVIVQCPKGHELQAAREHLTATLACPVCGIEFVPQAPAGVATANLPEFPSTMSYAGTDLLSQPIDYPAVTPWMTWLWMGAGIVQTLQVLALMTVGQPTMTVGQPQLTGPLVAVMAVVGVMSCLSGIAILVAFVLQLIWIFRIHKDARRARDYRKVSPGLALGLSFVPIIHSIWTAWTLRNLAKFSAETIGAQGGENPEVLASANHATRNYLSISVFLLVMICSSTSYILYTMWGPLMKLATTPGGASQMQIQAEFQQLSAQAISPWLQVGMQCFQLLGIYLFFQAVRKLEAALYPALGAPPR